MHPSKNDLEKEVTEHLRNSPLRVTRKRERILDALLAFDRPVSALEVLKCAGLPESDLVTVYRTLEAFESITIVQRIPLESGGHIFELIAPGDHHHHFICRHCNHAERLDLCLMKDFEKKAFQLGFTELTHLMEVYGLCRDCCQEKNKERAC